MAVHAASNYFYDSDDIVHLFTVAGRNAVRRFAANIAFTRGDANAPINSRYLPVRGWLYSTMARHYSCQLFADSLVYVLEFSPCLHFKGEVSG